MVVCGLLEFGHFHEFSCSNHIILITASLTYLYTPFVCHQEVWNFQISEREAEIIIKTHLVYLCKYCTITNCWHWIGQTEKNNNNKINKQDLKKKIHYVNINVTLLLGKLTMQMTEHVIKKECRERGPETIIIKTVMMQATLKMTWAQTTSNCLFSINQAFSQKK